MRSAGPRNVGCRLFASPPSRKLSGLSTWLAFLPTTHRSLVKLNKHLLKRPDLEWGDSEAKMSWAFYSWRRLEGGVQGVSLHVRPEAARPGGYMRA